MNGKWDGDVFYTYAEGPRKGKRDLEKWSNGELISSQKYYGQGEALEVADWEDLKKLDDLTGKRKDVDGRTSSYPEKECT